MPIKILVADDEPALRHLVSATLGSGRYQIVEASGGLEASELALEELPDLVLLDVSMPGLTGVEVCRRLRAEPLTRAIPVVMLTAHAQPHERQAGLEAGATEYLTKPFSPLELLEVIQRLV